LLIFRKTSNRPYNGESKVNKTRIFPYDSVKAEDVQAGAAKTRVRWLITEQLGAPNFAMRVFEIAPTGYSPFHSHPWEHEVFILKGEGQLFDGHDASSFKAGDVVFVPPNEQHQFKNNSSQNLEFICLIPHGR
jgi:quercetin dioxygenase-like cupin family protein